MSFETIVLADADIEVTASGRLSNGASRGRRLVELADEVDADMVVLGGHGRSPAGKAVFGSTAQDVMLEYSRPVTFVRAASSGCRPTPRFPDPVSRPTARLPHSLPERVYSIPIPRESVLDPEYFSQQLIRDSW